MPYVNVFAEPETELHYVDVGEGQPIVLIHGWPLSHRMWERQIYALVDAGYRCIAYDRRGFGDSGMTEGGYDYDTFASDLNDLIEALDLQEVVLAGFSMGGGEVARYIGNYGTERIAKAMLLGAVPPFLLQTEDNPEGAPQSLFDGMIDGVKKDRIGFLETFFPNFYNSDANYPGVSADLIPYSKSIAWMASPTGTQQCITAFGTTDFREDLAKFTIPTLIVHGDADRIVPIDISGRKSAELIEGSRFAVIAGAPHGFAATHAEQLNELMIEFLRT
jgi:peroxiredoxin